MKRIGIIIALLGCQLYATTVVLHVFPLVVEFKNTGQGFFEPQWYLLLGKNTDIDVKFATGIFQEFGGTEEVQQTPLLDKTLWNLAINKYLVDGTKNIYNSGDLSSLIKKQQNGYFDDQVYKADTRLDERGVRHEYIYVLLDARKPIARLNADGRNAYKTEFKWMLISEMHKFSKDQFKEHNIDEKFKLFASGPWISVDLHFIKKLCSKN